MKAYQFLSQHPKYEVESPTDGSKPPPKNPNSIRKGHVPEELDDAFNDNEESNTFVKLPFRKADLMVEKSPNKLMPSTSLWIRFQRGFCSIKPKIPLHCKICGSRLRPLSK